MLVKMLNFSIFVFHLLAIFLLSVSFQKDHLTFRCRMWGEIHKSLILNM